jgi:hypothetical protein
MRLRWGPQRFRDFPMPCSARFVRLVSRDALEERAECALGAEGSVRVSAPLPVRAEPLGACPGSDLGFPQFEHPAEPR